jgi:hypothetical protein
MMNKLTALLVVLLCGSLLGAVTVWAGNSNDRVVGYGQIKFKGHGPEWWHNRAAARYTQVKGLQQKLGSTTRALKRMRHVTLTSPDALTAIRLASLAYDVSFDTLYRRASCESTGESPASPPSNSTLNVYARNNGSSDSPMGLFQFKPSTFRSTPYGGYDIYNGYVNALAAAWMVTVGRSGEWACQ